MGIGGVSLISHMGLTAMLYGRRLQWSVDPPHMDPLLRNLPNMDAVVQDLIAS